MSFVGKEIKTTYRDILQTNNNNGGVSSSVKQIYTGKGDKTALAVSDRHVHIMEPAADSTSVFRVRNSDGSKNLLNVDSTNQQVTAGKNNKYVNTNCREFALYDFTPTGGYHIPMITNPVMASGSGDTFAHNAAFGGNGADPMTSLDFSSNATVYSKTMMGSMWYLPYAIYIDSAYIFVFCEASVSFNVHILKYDIATGTGTSAGDLSNGTVLATLDGISCTNTIINNQALNVATEEVEAGKVVFFFIESASTTQFSALGSVNYHIE